MLGLNEESIKDFQLYATILCDHLWMARNKARVEGPKVIQLIFPGKFLESSWSIRMLGRSKMRDHSKMWSGLPLQRVGSRNFDVAIREEKTTVAVVRREIGRAHV